MKEISPIDTRQVQLDTLSSFMNLATENIQKQSVRGLYDKSHLYNVSFVSNIPVHMHFALEPVLVPVLFKATSATVHTITIPDLGTSFRSKWYFEKISFGIPLTTESTEEDRELYHYFEEFDTELSENTFLRRAVYVGLTGWLDTLEQKLTQSKK